jgi:hypothetical protein
MQGWIKIHRQLQDKGYINKPAYVSLWVNLLLLANHKEKELLWNGSLIIIKRGQLITGRKELSKLTGIPETTIERILKVFKNGHQIEQQTYNKYRLITILNWDKYQVVDNKRTSNGHQMDTNKNERMKEVLGETSSPQLEDKEKNMFNKYGEEYTEGVVDYDGDGTLQEIKKPPTRKYPNAPAVRKLFEEIQGRNPANWKVNKTQLQACENLYTERGLESVKKALLFHEEYQDKEYCPKISSPYDLDTKWIKLGEFKLSL